MNLPVPKLAKVASAFLFFSLSLPVHAADKIYCLNVNYSAVNALVNSRKLTLMVNVGTCSSVSVLADGSSIPVTYNAGTGMAIFTTTGSALQVTAVNWTTGGTGAATKATLFNNYKWSFSLTLDDGIQSQVTNAKPLLDAKGWKAGAAVVGNWANTGGMNNYMSWATVQSLRTAGWEIYNHTFTHPNPVNCGNFTTEFDQNQTQFTTRLPGYHVNHIVYPYEVSTAAGCAGFPPSYLISGEVAGGLNFVDNPLPNVYLAGRSGLYGTDPTSLQTMAAGAAGNARPAWMIVITHGVAAGGGAPPDAYATNANTLGTLLNYLDSNFGTPGNKSMWFAPSGEVMDYIFTRDKAVVSVCTPVVTITSTPTRTNTPMPPTSTSTVTRTNTSVPPTLTRTNTPVPPTQTSTATRSMTPSPTASLTSTRTSTVVPPTQTLTATSTLTRTNTAVPPTSTNTAVPPTSTLTRTNTVVPPTSTNTPVPATSTSTLTRTNTLVPPTFTSTLTRSMTPTASSTTVPPTSTNTPVPPTLTSTLTRTSTAVPPTSTSTTTRTNTQVPPTLTATPTLTISPTATDTGAPTATRTATSSVTATASSTDTAVPTQTSTATSTATLTISPTATDTGAPTATRTATPSSTSTLVNTPTSTTTSTASRTATPSATSSPTLTLSPTATFTLSSTPSRTATGTTTSTSTLTSVNTTTATSTLTQSPTSTSTASPSSTRTATPSSTATLTASNTPTLVPTSTSTPIFTATATNTQTLSPTVTQSPTCTVVPTTNPIIFPNPVSTGSVVILPQAYTGLYPVTVQIYTTGFKLVLEKVFPPQFSGTTVKVDLLDNWGQALADGIYHVYVTVNQDRKATNLAVMR